MRPWAAIALSVLLLTCSSDRAAASERIDQVLARIKKMFILKEGSAGTRTDECAGAKSLLFSLLNRELSQMGYSIVAEASGADAILKGNCEVEVMLDDEGPRPPDIYKYAFRLASANDERFWKTSITIRTLEGPEKAGTKATVLLAERLHKAVQSALRISGKQKAKVR